MDSRVKGRHGPAAYVYRRELGVLELLPAVGAGIVTGLAAFYVARLLLQRTPLVPESDVVVAGDGGRPGRRPVPRPARRGTAAERG